MAGPFPISGIALVINLERSSERRKVVQRRMADAGIPFSWVAAVDGSLLAPRLREVSQLRARIENGRRLEPGEIGNTWSHLIAAQQLLATDRRWALVLEDDAEPLPGLLPFLEEHSSQIEAFGVINLVHQRDGVRSPALVRRLGDFDLHPASPRTVFTVGYLISRQAAATISKTLLPVRAPSDVYLYNPRLSGVSSFWIEPPLIGHDLSLPNVVGNDRFLHRGVVWKLSRRLCRWTRDARRHDRMILRVNRRASTANPDD